MSLSHWRRIFNVLGDIDTLASLPQWFVWLKSITAIMASGFTAWTAVAEDIPTAYGIVAALLVFGSVLWVWNQVYARKLHRKAAGDARGMAGPPSCQWLLDMAEEDKKGEGVICIGTHVQWRLDGISPYVELTILFWNSLVWPVAIDASITGRVKCAGLEFPNPPEFMRPPPSGIPHAKGATVTLRQPASGKTLFAMREASGPFTTFDFDTLYLHSLIAVNGHTYKRRLQVYSSFPVVLPGAGAGPVG